MTMKNDEKFQKKLTCRFKIDVRNLTNFYLSTQRSQRFLFWWAAFGQSIQCLSWKRTEELSFVTLESDSKFQEELTCQFKIDMKNLKVVSATFLLVCFLSLNESPCQARKNDIWISGNLKFDYLKNKKSFQSEIKNIFPCFTSPLF